MTYALDIEDTRTAPEPLEGVMCVICEYDFPLDTCTPVKDKYICQPCFDEIVAEAKSFWKLPIVYAWKTKTHPECLECGLPKIELCVNDACASQYK